MSNVKARAAGKAFGGAQQMPKSFVVLAIALALFLLLPAKTYAFWPFDLFSKGGSTGSQAKFPIVIQKIIDKFSLNSGEVQKVMEEVQTERQQEARNQREAKLEEAVKAGVITSEQKQTLLDRQGEWQEKQRQLMEEKRQWIEKSGIDFEKLAPYRAGFGSKGFGGRGFGQKRWFGGF